MRCPGFANALAEEPNETVRDFVWLSLLTGGRRSNVQANAMGRNQPRDGQLGVYPRQRTARPLTVPLSPLGAAKILKSRMPKDTKEQPWVFPATQGVRWSSVRAQGDLCLVILKRGASITGMRIHDLRRSLGSWMAGGGASLFGNRQGTWDTRIRRPPRFTGATQHRPRAHQYERSGLMQSCWRWRTKAASTTARQANRENDGRGNSSRVVRRDNHISTGRLSCRPAGSLNRSR